MSRIQAREGGPAVHLEPTSPGRRAPKEERGLFDPETGLLKEERAQLDAWKPILQGGEPPLAGLKKVEAGKEVRKDPPEDVKVRDPQHRLFAVFDGVSSGGRGALAAKLTGKIVSERLGDEFERGLENIRGNTRLSSEDRATKMRVYVETAMKSAVRAAHEATGRIQGGDTTASIAKLVAFPDGEMQLFTANVGDSRVYLDEGEGVESLTQDDGLVSRALHDGDLNPAQAVRIDQAVRHDDLTPVEQMYFAQRNIVTEVVGGLHSKKPMDVPVSSRPVHAGERLVITSDGVHDNLLLRDLRRALAQATDDRQAEKLLQLMADELAKKPQAEYGRAKKDDISALVYTVPEALPSALEAPIAVSEASAWASWDDVAKWNAQLAHREVDLRTIEAEIARRGGMRSLDLRKQLLDQKIAAAKYEWGIRKTELELVARAAAPALAAGTRVRLPERLARSLGASGEIVGFEVDADEYLVKVGPSMYQRIDRTALEVGKLIVAADVKAVARGRHAKRFIEGYNDLVARLTAEREALDRAPQEISLVDLQEQLTKARLQAHLRNPKA